MENTKSVGDYYYGRFSGRSLEVQRGEQPVVDPQDFLEEHGDFVYLDDEGYLTDKTLRAFQDRHLITETFRQTYRHPVAKSEDAGGFKLGPAVRRDAFNAKLKSDKVKKSPEKVTETTVEAVETGSKDGFKTFEPGHKDEKKS